MCVRVRARSVKLQLPLFTEWFVEASVFWLDTFRQQCAERLERALAIDKDVRRALHLCLNRTRTTHAHTHTHEARMDRSDALVAAGDARDGELEGVEQRGERAGHLRQSDRGVERDQHRRPGQQVLGRRQSDRSALLTPTCTVVYCRSECGAGVQFICEGVLSYVEKIAHLLESNKFYDHEDQPVGVTEQVSSSPLLSIPDPSRTDGA